MRFAIAGGYPAYAFALTPAEVAVSRGVLFAGIIVGPHVLDIFGKDRPVADFTSQLGILLDKKSSTYGRYWSLGATGSRLR